MTTNININGIHELDVTLPGTVTAHIVAPGITSLSAAGLNGTNAKAGNYTALSSDNQKLIVFTGSSLATLTLPTPGTNGIDSNFVVWVAAVGTGGVSITPTGASIDALSTVSLTQYQGLVIFNDGTNYYTSRGMGSGGGGTSSLVIGFIINLGVTGSNVGPTLVAPRTANITKCVFAVKQSDNTTALQFRIKQNGADVFATDPTIAAGTSGGTVLTFSLSSSSLTVTAGDVFVIDILSGTANWMFTAQLET